ncbi:MAG: magnesium transporter, partial [Verrucomicrobiota bacterium]
MASEETNTSGTVEVEDILDAFETHSPERVQELVQNAHPGDVEQAFERLDDHSRETILDQLPSNVLAEWADYLPAADVGRRLNTLPKGEQRKVLDSLSDDELVDLLQEMEEEDRPQYFELLPDEKREVSENLMQYPEETAGGRMTTAMATIQEGLTVKEALDELRVVKEEAELLSRIYVLDVENRILGKVRLRDLAFSTWDTPVADLMDSDQICIRALEDQEEAAQMIARYDLVALPVVDEENRLVGVITHDDALEILEEESTEDMEKISGIGGDRGDSAYLQMSVFSHFRRRAGWVVILAFLALTSGWVLLKYEDVLTAVFLLALYFPMVVAAGGNTGAQSATMVIRAMSLGELDVREFGRVVWKESRIGILLGAMLGTLVALQVCFLLPDFLLPATFDAATFDPWTVALVVGLALTVQVFSSTLIGAILPIGA